VKRIIWIVSGMVVLVVLLAGAAFVAGRMWSNKAPQDEALAGPLPVAPVEDTSESEAVMMQIKGAQELPQRPPDAIGVFSRREDNRIFVSSSGKGVVIMEDGGAASDPQAQEVEVVVTGETTVYEDVTQKDLGDEPPSGGVVQQKVQPGSVEAIGQNSFVVAWGEKSGDRLVADILVYTGPPVINR
jgi:hypothetical protein